MLCVNYISLQLNTNKIKINHENIHRGIVHNIEKIYILGLNTCNFKKLSHRCFKLNRDAFNI